VAVLEVFDGKGNFTQRDYAGNSVPADFSPPGQETGTYQVNPDCTASLVINLNVSGVPAGTSHGVIKALFAISDGGRHINLVVSEFTPPGSTAPVPTQTSSEGWKVAPDWDDAVMLSSGATGGDDFRCSNATLNGQYAFGVTSYTPSYPPTVVAGIKVFDGEGGFSQRDYGGDSVPADFSPPRREKGTYQVNSDCTGSLVIHLNVPGVPAGASHGEIHVLFVISDGGRHIHEVVSEFTPPGSSGPAPTQTSADDWKVASEQDE
jgi:hypothetical protein